MKSRKKVKSLFLSLLYLREAVSSLPQNRWWILRVFIFGYQLFFSHRFFYLSFIGVTWLACVVARTAADTRALELESPEFAGMLPHTVASIPVGISPFSPVASTPLCIISIAPLIPQRKYLCHEGPFSSRSSNRLLKAWWMGILAKIYVRQKEREREREEMSISP